MQISNGFDIATPAGNFEGIGNTMRFLVKLFVLGFIGLAVLPAFAPEEYRASASVEKPDAREAPSPFEVTTFVWQAMSDIRDICERQASMCETGRDVIAYAGSRAREGFVIAYAMLRGGHPTIRTENATPVREELSANS
jgi:hypothetical protein